MIKIILTVFMLILFSGCKDSHFTIIDCEKTPEVGQCVRERELEPYANKELPVTISPLYCTNDLPNGYMDCDTKDRLEQQYLVKGEPKK